MKVQLNKYNFSKKCDFDLCQNKADYSLEIGAKGNVLICQECLAKLKKILKLKSGETYERTKQN